MRFGTLDTLADYAVYYTCEIAAVLFMIFVYVPFMVVVTPINFIAKLFRGEK